MMGQDEAAVIAEATHHVADHTPSQSQGHVLHQGLPGQNHQDLSLEIILLIIPKGTVKPGMDKTTKFACTV